MTVFIGTAGFSYGDWKGNFYPEGIKPSQMLVEYARRFPVVEINSSFYAIPAAKSIASMADRTPPHFTFTVKANRGMTHETGEDPDVFSKFRHALRPLLDHGKLGCVLAQFPWGFKNNPKNRAYLEVLARNMEGLDTVVEFRNSEWDSDETVELLEELGLGYCCVDEPRMKGLVSPRIAVTSDTGYVRFHGRNYRAWWGREREAWERYDYLYSEEELREWRPKVESIAEKSDRVYVIFNNHYKGQAPTNARMFEEMLRSTLGDQVFRVPGGERGQSTLFQG